MGEVARLNDHATQDDRLELLLFHLAGAQRFGINVLKVKEIIPAPKLTQVPHAHPAVRGVAHLRGEPLPVVDMSMAVGRGALGTEQGQEGQIIITEFNRRMQGFFVSRVDRIALCDWKQVYPPPKGSGMTSYITGVTRIDDELVQILDVERILGEVIAELDEHHAPELELEQDASHLAGRRVMVVDDSSVARHQTTNTLEQIGVEVILARDGREALELLKRTASGEGEPVDMIISDIEMPEMDGYTLTREVRNDPQLADLYILLHTSLNGAINSEKAHKAGANEALTKFVPIELAKAVIAGLEQHDSAG